MLFPIQSLPLIFGFPEPTTPVSPYAVYNGQRQSSVYQPTEIALIAKHLKEVSMYDASSMAQNLFSPSAAITSLRLF